MKGYIRDFLKYNRSNSFIKWSVVLIYFLFIIAFASICVLFAVSGKQYSGISILLAIALLAGFVFIILKLRSDLMNTWVNLGGAKDVLDYAEPKTESISVSKATYATISIRSKINGLDPSDYVLNLVRQEALSGTGYKSLAEYLSNDQQDNDLIAASEKIAKDASKGIKE